MIMDKQISNHDSRKRELLKGGVFSPDAISLNHKGFLSLEQKKILMREVYFWLGLIGFCLVLFLAGWILFLGLGQGLELWLVWGCISMISLSYSWMYIKPLLTDLTEGCVKSIGGEVHKHETNLHYGGGKGLVTGYRIISIGNHAFDVKPTVYSVIVEHKVYRIFYLPRSRKVVNI